MKTPNFSNNQFIDATSMNSMVGMISSSLKDIDSALFTPGLINPSSLSLTQTAGSLVATVSAPLPFRVLFSNGTLAAAYGTTNGATNSTYNVNFASLVPATGSVEVYLVASAVTINQSPYTVVGPPVGHPDYNPNFVSYTAYSEIQDSISFTATTTVPDNLTYIEVGRISLTAGQTTFTASFDTTHQVVAAASFADYLNILNNITFGSGNRFYSEVSITGNTTLDQTYSGRFLEITGGTTTTLPPPSASLTGVHFLWRNISATPATFTAANASYLLLISSYNSQQTVAGVSTYTIGPGVQGSMYCDGVNWVGTEGYTRMIGGGSDFGYGTFNAQNGLYDGGNRAVTAVQNTEFTGANRYFPLSVLPQGGTVDQTYPENSYQLPSGLPVSILRPRQKLGLALGYGC